MTSVPRDNANELAVRFRDTVSDALLRPIVKIASFNRGKDVIRLTPGFLAIEKQLNHGKFGHQHI